MINPGHIHPNRDPLRVVVLAYDGLCTFEFGIVVEIFGRARPELRRWYTLQIAAIEPGPIRASGGFVLEAEAGLEAIDTAGTVIVPGWRELDAPVPDGLSHALRRTHQQGGRVLSVCSGAFVLGAAGLLDGRRATTHWLYASTLARRFPRAEIDPDVLYVDADRVLTSAGSAAGIDLALHLVRCDHGSHVANTVARRLVVPPHRDGGQKQFVNTAVNNEIAGHSFAVVLDRLRANLAHILDVQSMATFAHMSPRTLARRFRDVVGTTPHRWLQVERVRQAQVLLEHADDSLDRVAMRVGLSDAQVLRTYFKRVLGTTPSDYRRSFAQRTPGGVTSDAALPFD